MEGLNNLTFIKAKNTTPNNIYFFYKYQIYTFKEPQYLNMIEVGIVDDHLIFRDALTFFFINEKKFRVTLSACNGKDLFNKLQSTNKFPEIIILDYVMPLMNGKEVLIKLKNDFPMIKTIMLSSITHEHTIIDSFKTGASGYLIKGCSIDILQETIDRVLRNEKVLLEEDGSLRSYKSDFPAGVTVPKLSNREIDFLKLCANGNLNYQEIAIALGLSLNTIHRYREELFKKLDLNSRTGLALYAFQTGIISI